MTKYFYTVLIPYFCGFLRLFPVYANSAIRMNNNIGVTVLVIVMSLLIHVTKRYPAMCPKRIKCNISKEIANSKRMDFDKLAFLEFIENSSIVIMLVKLR